MERISWQQAVDEVAGKLSHIRDSYGPHSIAAYMGNPMAFCTYGALSVPAFAKALGTSQFYTSGSQDCNNKFAAAQRVLGSPVLHPIPDINHVQYLLMIGANPAVSGMSFTQVPRPVEALQNIKKRGGEIVVVDPRRTETARLATEHLFIQPDTDCFFLLSLLCVVIEKDLYHRRWATEDGSGFSALKELVLNWPPDRTEPITGIPKEKIKEIAHRLTGAKPAACYGSIGMNLGRFGTLNYWLLLALNILSGHFDRKGGSILCRGVMDMRRLYQLSGLGKNSTRSRIGDFPPVMGTYPASLIAHEILKKREDRIRALVVVAGNPLLSVPNELHLKAALEKLDLLVCLDIYQNETGAFAHYLLPTTDFLEREDLNLSHTGLQQRRYVAYTPAVVTPDQGQRPEWEILQSLADRMGNPLWGKPLTRFLWIANRIPCRSFFQDSDDQGIPAPRVIFKVLLMLLGEVDLATIESSPRGIMLEPHTYGRFRGKNRWWLKGCRVDLAPKDLLREAWKLEGILSLRELERKEFLLIGKRERHTHNTWMHNADSLVKAETTNYLYIHPDDAKRKGILEGGLVRIQGYQGAWLEAPCRFSQDLKRGVIALPHGWGHYYPAAWTKARKRPGVNVNQLTSDSVWQLETFAGMAWLNGLPVEIRPVKTKAPRKLKNTHAPFKHLR
jgi:formate dehydrogenase